MSRITLARTEGQKIVLSIGGVPRAVLSLAEGRRTDFVFESDRRVRIERLEVCGLQPVPMVGFGNLVLERDADRDQRLALWIDAERVVVKCRGSGDVKVTVEAPQDVQIWRTEIEPPFERRHVAA